MSVELDRKMLKEVVREILIENPQIVKEAMHEAAQTDEELFEFLLNRNIQIYAESFKALA